MSATYADQGLTDLLQARNSMATGAFNFPIVRLYTAVSGGISKASVYTDFTEVGGVMGYSAWSMNGATDWSYALDTVNHWVIATAAHVWTFTPGAGLTILGYFASKQHTTVNLMLAEAFASPIVIPAGGGTLTLTLTDKYQQC